MQSGGRQKRHDPKTNKAQRVFSSGGHCANSKREPRWNQNWRCFLRGFTPIALSASKCVLRRISMNIAKWPGRGLSICLYLFVPLLYGGLPQQWYASTPTTNNLNAAAYGQGLMVVVGDNRTILRSPDGFAWQAGNASSTYPPR